MRSYSFDFNIASTSYKKELTKVQFLKLNEMKSVYIILLYLTFNQLFFRLEINFLSTLINIFIFICSIYKLLSILKITNNDRLEGKNLIKINSFILILTFISILETFIALLFYRKFNSGDKFEVYFKILMFLSLILRSILMIFIQYRFKSLIIELDD
jgi:hypothetical protein